MQYFGFSAIYFKTTLASEKTRQISATWTVGVFHWYNRLHPFPLVLIQSTTNQANLGVTLHQQHHVTWKQPVQSEHPSRPLLTSPCWTGAIVWPQHVTVALCYVNMAQSIDITAWTVVNKHRGMTPAAWGPSCTPLTGLSYTSPNKGWETLCIWMLTSLRSVSIS